jgi:hypothetical protein
MVATVPEIETYLVGTPSGATLEVLTDSEVAYFRDRHTRYLKDNRLVNISDLQDLDRVLAMELMVWRWQSWTLKGMDWWGNDIDEKDLRGSIKAYSSELRALKETLGLDKATRDKEKGEDVATYIEKLRERAKQFGVMRNEQCAKIITLFQELAALIMLMHNTTGYPDEQKEQLCSEQDVIKWIVDVALPEFNAIDSEFKTNEQRFWIRDV